MCNNRLTKEIIETRYKLKIKNQEDLKAAIKIGGWKKINTLKSSQNLYRLTALYYNELQL